MKIIVNTISCTGGHIEFSDNGGGSYDLHAIPESGYTFLMWSDSVFTATRRIYKSSAETDTFRVVFIKDDLNGIGGSVQVDLITAKPLSFQLTATPLSCYNFIKWKDGSKNQTRAYIVGEDCHWEAMFRRPEFSISNLGTDGGYIFVQDDTCQYVLTAIPNNGYTFIGWSDGNQSAQRTVPYDEGSLSAQFIPSLQLGSVSDWEKNAVILRTNQVLDDYTALTSIGVSEEFTQSTIEKVDAGIYKVKIPSAIGQYDNNINIRFINSCDGLAALQRFTIPVVVDEETNSSSLPNNKDVFVLPSAKLLVNNAFNANSVVVYGGGKVSIPANTSMSVNAMSLRAGAVMGNSYGYLYPQLFVDGSLTYGNLTYDYLLNNSVWYPMSLPQARNFSNMNYMSGASANNKFIVEYYDGQLRTGHVSGWRDVPSLALSQGVGYNLFIMPESISMAEGQTTRLYSRLRIPLTLDLSEGEQHSPAIAVKAYGANQSDVDFVDMGWNFVGNPYMADYIGDILLNSNPVNYVTIPADDGQSYTQEVTEVAQLPAFRNFFVQVEESGELTFNRSYRLRKAPLQSDEESLVGLVLSSNSLKDKVGIRIADKYTDQYEINADLLKFANATLNVYALSSAGDLAFIAINSSNAGYIPLGYSAPKGEYTFSMNEQYAIGNLEYLFLIDTEANCTTDLLQEAYTFTTTGGVNNHRFIVVCVTNKTDATTFLDNEKLDMPIIKFVQDGQLFIRQGNALYNAQGERIK